MKYPSLVAFGVVLLLGIIPAAGETPRIARSFLIEVPADFSLQDDTSHQRLQSFPVTPLRSLDDAKLRMGGTTWFKLELEQPAGGLRQDQVLRLNTAIHNRAEALLLENGRVIDRFEAGSAVPAERQRHSSAHLTLPLSTWKTERAEVLIAIKTAQATPLRPRIIADRELQTEDRATLALYFAYLGALAVLVIVQGAIFLHLKDRASRDYSLVSICLLVLLFTQSGDFKIIWDGFIGTFHLSDVRHPIRIIHGILCLLAFGSFFSFSTVAPWLHRLLQAGIAVLSAIFALSFILPASVVQPLSSAFQAATAAVLIAACIEALRHRLLGSRLIAIGWLPMLLTGIYLNLARFRILPDFTGETTLPVLSIIWEILFTTLGLSYKLKQLAEIRHQQELRELELAGMERMARVLCHDLSTPLATIGMTTDLLQLNREAGRTLDLDATTNRLQLAVKSIKEIVDSTRHVEALKLHGGNLPIEPVDLCVAFDEAERLVQDKLSRKRITLRKADWPEFALVMAEQRMLRLSIIANALSNAVKFSPAGSVIDVAIRRDDGAMVLSIRDHGMGIPRELREAFSRSGRIQSRPGTMNEEGTGFGVMLMRDFTKAMGGEFRLESRTAEESPSDHGTTVDIRMRMPVATGGNRA